MRKPYNAALKPALTAQILRDIVGMSTSPTKIQDGLKQGQYPFGDCIKTGNSCVYDIYPVPLKKWILEKFGVDVDINAYRGKTLEENYE